MAVSDASFDPGRLVRTLVLIAFVTGVFLVTGANVLSGTLYRVAVAAIGSVALVTAITSFLISVASAADPSAPR
jgi:hypothetical protein